MTGLKFPLEYWQHKPLLRLFVAALLGLIAGGYVWLLLQFSPITQGLLADFSTVDGVIMLSAAGLVFLPRLVRRWLEHSFDASLTDFKIGLRLFSRELIKVKSGRELESLVSWELPSNFRLRNAELAFQHNPRSPYALRLPLAVSNVSLGELFLGTKIDGKEFSPQEELVLAEVQKQVSLAAWSLELDRAIQATEELTRLKSQFLANVTHELRTPLNGIINYIGFVVDEDTGPLNEEQAYYLKGALRSAEKLLEIINNILDMSKIEAGAMTLQLDQVNLAELVDEILPLTTELLNDKPIELKVELFPALPVLQADRLRLRQVILNMLSNAAKFTEAGAITLKLYPDNGHAVIQVADTGIGIKEEVLPTIYEEFISVGLTDTEENFGPGLSMPIAKALVEMHGGQMEVESQVGQGTTVTVRLPL
jgi:signal transduction histidine kinase